MNTRQFLGLDEALALLRSTVAPIAGTSEVVPLESAADRVLAETIAAPMDVPPFFASAMDGYAIRLADIASSATLRVAQRIPAGSVGKQLEPGTAARIFTGAPIPPGADAVAMQENCSVSSF